jgi:hypothetical protein
MQEGDACAVFGCDPSGIAYHEGTATIHDCCAEPHQYRVRFIGERVLRTRFINPDWQRDPERSLALLLAFWRASKSGSFDEFFPDDLRNAKGTAP